MINETLIADEQRMLKLNEESTTDGFEAKYVTEAKSCRLSLDKFWAHEGKDLNRVESDIRRKFRVQRNDEFLIKLINC